MTQAAGRIDVHFHSVPPAFRDAITEAALGPAIRTPIWTPELSMEVMDRNGIGSAITSISVPGTHFGDDAKARSLSRRCNDYSAEIISRWPKRFGAFAAVPLPDLEGTCEEIRYALDVLKLDGIGLFTSYSGKHLGDPGFDPVLEVLNDYAAVTFIHPTNHPSGQAVHLGVPGFLMEYLFDTTRAAVNLVLSGAMDRFPRIRFILSHAGGTLPYIAWRVSHIAWRQLAEPPFSERFPLPLIEQNSGQISAELVLSRIRRFWYDTALSAGRQTFGALNAVADPGRILFGSDWPYAPETMTRDSIKALGAPGFLSEAQRAGVDRGNALQLFPRLA